MIHATAIIDPHARIASGVSIGPWCDIGAEVEIAEGTELGPHVVVRGPTRIGRNNRIYQFNSIGDDSQDRKFAGERARLEIGDGNVIREFCTLNRGTLQGGGVTRLGSENWVMAYVHIAHDCEIGSGVVMANGASLAGHVTVQDHATFGGFTLVHQFCTIGAYSFSAMGSVVLKDVPPYVMIAGNTAKAHGLNTEGLKRHGFDAQTIGRLKRAYKTIYKRGLTVEQAVAELEQCEDDCPRLARLLEFVRSSARGIVR